MLAVKKSGNCEQGGVDKMADAPVCAQFKILNATRVEFTSVSLTLLRLWGDGAFLMSDFTRIESEF